MLLRVARSECQQTCGETSTLSQPPIVDATPVDDGLILRDEHLRTKHRDITALIWVAYSPPPVCRSVGYSPTIEYDQLVVVWSKSYELHSLPALKSAMTCGAEASKPTTSSVPGSLGSAMVKSVAVRPTTTRRAEGLIFSR